MEFWIAFAATSVLVGSTWQVVLEFRRQIRAMSFLRAHNELVREELQRIRRDVPAWRRLKRRRERRDMNQTVLSTLTSEEAAQVREFDGSGVAWTCVAVGTLIGTVIAWGQCFASV